MRVCILTNILPPYRTGFYRALAKLCELTVVVDSVSSPDRQWHIDMGSLGFELVIAGNRNHEVIRKGQHYAVERRYLSLGEHIVPLLRQIKPDVVVSVELGARTLMASWYAGRCGIPLVCYWEGTPHTEAQISRLRRTLRPWLARRANAFWVNGRESARYAANLGVAPSRVHEGMTGVDTRYFQTQSAYWLTRRHEERASLGLSGLVFGFSGTLSPRKGVSHYLAAIEQVVDSNPDVDISLLFIGDGELRPEVEAWSRKHRDLPVVVTGFQQLPELPRFYSCADWMVLPTLDDCGPMATLEAAACGLPQVLSPYGGASVDLLAWPGMGMLADPLDHSAFSKALLAALDRGPTRIDESVTAAVAEFYGPTAQAERAYRSLKGLVGNT